MATDLPPVPRASVPTAHLAQIITAALRLINSSIPQLPAHDLASVLPLLRHTNALTSHTIRRFGVTAPGARGVEELQVNAQQLDHVADEVAELGDYLNALNTAGLENLAATPEEGGPGAPETAAVAIPPALVVAALPAPAAVVAPAAAPAPAAVVAPAAAPAPAAGAAAAQAEPRFPPPYDAPPLTADEEWPKKWYVITSGRRVGIFTNIQEVNRYVAGVSQSVHQGFKLWSEAQVAYNSAFSKGWLKIL